MKKFFKKIVLFVTVFAMCIGIGASLSACNSSDKTLIGIGLYQDSGPAVTATKAYLDGLKEELNCDFKYVTLSQTDEATNKTRVQELISAGCKGIILTMDLGMSAIIAECEKADVYLAGYLSDYETTLDSIKDNDHFVGTVVDGAYNGTAWGEHIAERVINEGYKNIGMIKFPAFAFPHQIEMDTAFRAKIEEYNATATEKITVQATTTELNFSPLDAAYFSENPNLDAIFAMCAGVDFVYPTMVAQEKTNIKLYTAGFTTSESTLSDFGEGKCIQELVFSNVEAVTYPVVMLLNKINGTEFSDNPAQAERVDSSQIIIENTADLQLVQTKSIYCTGKAEDAFLTASQVKALLAENGGTYAKLVEAVQSMTIEDLEDL